MATVRIAIVEDREIVRKGLQVLLGEIPNCILVGVYTNIVSLNEEMQKAYPQILILDDTLPGIDTCHLVRHLKVEYPALKIIIFGSNFSASTVYELFDAHADGFIYKGEVLEHILVEAVAFVTQGKIFISPHVAMLMLTYSKSNKPVELTERLKVVLSLMALRFSVKESAKILNISPKAVYNARERLKELLNADNTADILSKAIELKLITPNDTDEDT